MLVKILDANLFISQVELEHPLLLAHANFLAMMRRALYPVTHTQIKTFKASSGAQQVSIDSAFLSPFPERIPIESLKYLIHWFFQYESIPLSSL